MIQTELGADAAPEIVDVTSIKAAGEALKDGDDASTNRINRWIGHESAVGLSKETFATCYDAVLSTVAGIDTQTQPD